MSLSSDDSSFSTYRSLKAPSYFYTKLNGSFLLPKYALLHTRFLYYFSVYVNPFKELFLSFRSRACFSKADAKVWLFRTRSKCLRLFLSVLTIVSCFARAQGLGGRETPYLIIADAMAATRADGVLGGEVDRFIRHLG